MVWPWDFQSHVANLDTPTCRRDDRLLPRTFVEHDGGFVLLVEQVCGHELVRALEDGLVLVRVVPPTTMEETRKEEVSTNPSAWTLACFPVTVDDAVLRHGLYVANVLAYLPTCISHQGQHYAGQSVERSLLPTH